MAMNDNGIADIVETEITKGEQDNVFEEYPHSERETTRGKLRSKVSATRTKRDVSRTATKSASARIVELARPTKQRALNTLNEKAMTLPPAFVDNLVKIVEAESCLTPEEAAQIRRRRKRRTRKVTRLPPPLAKKRAGEIADDTARATMLDRDATMCQYLMAERFVKSILESRRETRKKDIREIADVIMKRLTSLDGYADAKNGDRATRQLRLLADVVACWMVEIFVEVAETYKEALKEYGKKRRMRMLEVDDDNETNSKTEDWKQTEKMKEKKQQDRENYETIPENNPMKEKNVEKQKGENKDDDAEAREREQLDEREAKSEDVRNETVEKEKNEENRKEEKEEEGKEVRETEEREGKEEKRKEATMEE